MRDETCRSRYGQARLTVIGQQKRGLDFVQRDEDRQKFKLGPLGNLNQVTKGLAKTIRAMADGSLDSQVGARICNGLGICGLVSKPPP
jgi:hypothetical protein